MFLVTEIDTLYNGLTLRHRNTINAAVGGTFMKRRPKECYDLIENMTAHHNDWDTSAQQSESSSSITSSSDPKIMALKAKMAEINKNLKRVLQVNQQVKAVTPSCKTCGGPHSYNDCPATVGQTHNVYVVGAYQGASHGQNPPPAFQAPAYQALGYQALVHQPLIPQPQVVTTNEFTNFMKANDAILKNMQTNMTSLTNSNLELKNMFGQFMKMNTASSLGLGTLPDALILMPKFGPTIKTLLTNKDRLYELARTPLNKHCSVVLLKKLPEKLGDPGELTLRVGKEAITFNLDQTLRYSANYNDMMANRIDVIDMDCEEYSQEVLGFSDVIASGNPTPYYDPIVFTSSSTLTPFGESDFLLEEVDAFLALEDDPTSSEVDQSYVDTEGDILILEAFLNDDPSLPPPNQGNYLPEVHKELKICEAKSDKSSIDEPLEEYFEPAFQHQRRVNPKIYDVIKQEVLKLLDAGLIYPIFDSPWEKSHFMVKEGIVLGHKISKDGIEVDKAKVDVIAKLPHPTTVKGIRSFFGHAGFYRRFIKDFSKIARPMTHLLEKDTSFFFSKECLEAFKRSKEN
nr:reverse transcriptase domain-containing protein [Tanacetum cinerariifolium]